VDDASFVLNRWLGDLLSPPRCAACNEAVLSGRAFCAGCAATVEAYDDSHPDLAFGFYGGALAVAVRRLKYEDGPHLARPLGELLRGTCRAAGLVVDGVVPVPLHVRRLVQRGYNQAALLAHHVAAEVGAPLRTGLLARIVDTRPQVELSGEERKANVASAFVATDSTSTRGRSLALVDDVSTTGATLGACRKALLAAGATRVVGVVLARTSPSALGISLDVDAGARKQVPVPRASASSGCTYMP
jgi:ComF family protein